MKPVQSVSPLVLLTTCILASSCSSEDPSTGTGVTPIVVAPGGGGTPGANPGGATQGGAGGTTGAVTPSQPTPTPVPGSTAGGAPAGGAQSVIVVEDKPCEKKVRTAGKTIPDFMIVLDRSASMRTTVDASVSCVDIVAALLTPACYNVNCLSMQWASTTACGGTMPAGVDRWTPAVAALKSLTQMFQNKVNFGLTIFPGPEQGGGGMNAQCTTGTQRVPVSLNSAPAIAAALDATQPGGYTPTSTTLQAVLQQIQGKKTDPDTQLPPQYVLLVTDGAPNCLSNNPANDPQAHQATVAAIDALAKAGVKTYVIGYDASVDMNLARQLTEYARHGGTNNFYAVQDGPSLVSQFAAITGVVAECSYKLDMKPADPKYVLVELDGKKVNLNEADGWTIDDKNVTLQGAACSTLRDGSRPHTLAVTVECVPQVLN